MTLSLTREISSDRALEILESICDPLYVVDKDWRLVYVNESGERLWGIPTERTLGSIIWDLFPNVDFPSTPGYKMYMRAFTERIAVEYEFYSHAIEQWVRVNLYPTPDGGLIIHHHDITEKHNAQIEQERLLSIVRELSEERGRLMAVAGHDLRQPLQALSSCLDKLSPLVTSERDKRIFNLAKTAYNSMMLDLDMLAIASQLDQEVIPKFETFAIGSFLEAQSDIWLFHAEAKGLELRIVPSRLLISTDSGMLRTILHNIVGNAIKYTEKGKILIGCRRKDAFLSVEVIDSGLGIPDALQNQIFRAFKQLDGASDGLGLGLSIVQRTAERLGHKIEMSSRQGRGSRFAVLIPLDKSSLC